MTDNEIIKALECCSNRYDCYSCEYYNQYCKGDMNVTLKDALDLINRLRAENEKLIERILEVQRCDNELIETLNKIHEEKVKTAKAEILKEFVYELMQIPNVAVYKNEIKDLLEESVARINDN